MADDSDLDARDNLNRTALHFACKNGHLKVVKFLISRNVYVNGAALNNFLHKNEKEFVTPLDLAVQHNHSDVAKLLLAKGSALTMEKITKIAGKKQKNTYNWSVPAEGRPVHSTSISSKTYYYFLCLPNYHLQKIPA